MSTKWTPEKLAAVADMYAIPGIRLCYKRKVRRGGRLVRVRTGGRLIKVIRKGGKWVRHRKGKTMRMQERGGKLVRKYTPAHGVLIDALCLLPRADTVFGCYVNLHERGHFLLRHFNECDAPTKKLAELYTGNGELTEAEQEYQAEQWAISTMRRHGIPVSKTILKSAKQYVRDCLRDDRIRGDKGHPRHIRQWAKR